VGLRESFGLRRRELLRPEGLARTLERLRADGILGDEQSRELGEELSRALAGSRYVLGHLAAHAALGTVFLLDPTPLPLGTVSRLGWVVGNRCYESLLGTPERARVHSLEVLLVAALPVLGYAAYLLPLRRESEGTAFLFANHVSYALFDAPAASLIGRTPRPLRRLAYKLLPTAPTGGGGVR
jgi:hypothetical protein